MLLKQHNDFDIDKYKEECLAYSELKSFKKKLDKTTDIVERFLNLKVKTVVNWSGGKDSTAMVHLVNSIKPVKVVSEKDDMDFPGEIDYVKDVAKKFGWYIDIVSPAVNLWDIVQDHEITEDIHSSNTAFSSDYFYKILKDYQVENNVKGVFLGLRNQESKGRLMNFLTKSKIYYNFAWDSLICTPLSEWSAKDVFAYLFSNDIPIMDVYFNTKFIGHPEKIRKSWILPSAQTSQGQAQWLKYYYPDIFNKLTRIKPELRGYV